MEKKLDPFRSRCIFTKEFFGVVLHQRSRPNILQIMIFTAKALLCSGGTGHGTVPEDPDMFAIVKRETYPTLTYGLGLSARAIVHILPSPVS